MAVRAQGYSVLDDIRSFVRKRLHMMDLKEGAPVISTERGRLTAQLANPVRLLQNLGFDSRKALELGRMATIRSSRIRIALWAGDASTFTQRPNPFVQLVGIGGRLPRGIKIVDTSIQGCLPIGCGL